MSILDWFKRKPEVENKPCQPNEDTISSVVLNQLCPIFHGVPNHLSIFFSRNYDKSRRESELNAWQAKIDKYRAWADTVQDKKIRVGYHRWLNYYQRKITSARVESDTQKRRLEMEDYDKKLKTESLRIDSFLSTCKDFPKPTNL
jgi:hypothetical protein